MKGFLVGFFWLVCASVLLPEPGGVTVAYDALSGSKYGVEVNHGVVDHVKVDHVEVDVVAVTVVKPTQSTTTTPTCAAKYRNFALNIPTRQMTRYDVTKTLIRRDGIISTSVRRHFDVMCPLAMIP